jgi:hypothetical protein
MFFGLFAAARLLLYFVVGEGYGYFRDEFYYLACADHLAWGYVDQPPLSILLLKISRAVLGDSVMAIRLLPALAGAAAIFLTGWMARAIGGGRFAQALAMIAVLVTPIHLGLTGFYSMNALDVLLWTGAAALLIQILRCDSKHLWPWLGVVLGLGLLNKISMLWLGAGLGAGLLLTAHRRVLVTPGPWIALAIAGVMFLPHVIWQVANDWPTLEFIRNATGGKMVEVAIGDFVKGQIMMMHPLTLPIWLAGLVFLLRSAQLRPLAIAYIGIFALLALNGTSRSGYLSPAYTWLLAAGAVALERSLLPARWPVLRGAVVAVLFAGGLAFVPMALPVLHVDTYIAYAAKLGIGPSTAERKELAQLPQHYADMFGWNELVDEVARVYRTLSPEEQEIAGFFTYNYGEAGAIDLLGRKYTLPKASSGHNNYALWGLQGSGEVLIIIGGTQKGHLRMFEQVEQAGTTDCNYCMPYENNQPIWIARGLKVDLEEVWPQLLHFD